MGMEDRSRGEHLPPAVISKDTEIMAVEFICEPVKMQNIVAGAFRLTLDIPLQYSSQAEWLLRQCVKTGVLLEGVLSVKEESVKPW